MYYKTFILSFKAGLANIFLSINLIETVVIQTFLMV